ncbi:MAG: PIN domain-containing protein [Candidatus Woesearchaeota archaeon]
MLNIFKPKTKIILDTNFLFIPGDVGIDIFTEMDRLMNESYDLYVMDSTIKELEHIILTTGKQKQGLNAKLGLILIKQKNLKTINGSSKNYADESILDYAAKNPEKTIIATQDKDLKQQLKKIPVRIITLRQKKYLELG